MTAAIMIYPLPPTHRIVVLDRHLLGKHGDEYVAALVTWHGNYDPDECIAWFDKSLYNCDRYKGMLCEIKNLKAPFDFGTLH